MTLGVMQSLLQKYAPVGTGGRCIKITPPLITTLEKLGKGLKVCDEVL